MAAKKWRAPDVYGRVTLADGTQLNLDGSVHVDRLAEMSYEAPVVDITGKVFINFGGRGKAKKLSTVEQVNRFLDERRERV
jgi:hypothetical protein